jgi:hypothetical protein
MKQETINKHNYDKHKLNIFIITLNYLNIFNYHHSYLLYSDFVSPSSTGFSSIDSTDTFFTVVYEPLDSDEESLFYYDPVSADFDSSLLFSVVVVVLV